MRNLVLILVLIGVSACAAKQPQAVKKDSDKMLTLSEKMRVLETENHQLASEMLAIRDENGRLRANLANEMEALNARVKSAGLGGAHITIHPEILFASGSIRINRSGRRELHRVARVLRRLPRGTRIHVAGHTDNMMPTRKLRRHFPNNLELSVARALAVAQFLIKEEKLDPDLILVEGYGASSPVASNKTSSGRARNRRLNIYY